MNKLLSANFSRLKKDISFRIGILYMFAIGIIVPLSNFITMKKYGYTISLESGFCLYAFFMAILSSVFCSLFIGTEYNDGTMRNKLIAGHSRTAVYFSFLIVSIAAIFLMCLAYLISSLCTGIPLLGFFSDAAFPIVLGHIGTIFILAVAFTSICTAAAMLCQNKAATATVCILGVFIFLFFGAYIRARLEEPEYDQAYYFETEETSEAESAPPRQTPGMSAELNARFTSSSMISFPEIRQCNYAPCRQTIYGKCLSIPFSSPPSLQEPAYMSFTGKTSTNFDWRFGYDIFIMGLHRHPLCRSIGNGHENIFYEKSGTGDHRPVCRKACGRYQYAYLRILPRQTYAPAGFRYQQAAAPAPRRTAPVPPGQYGTDGGRCQYLP